MDRVLSVRSRDQSKRGAGVRRNPPPSKYGGKWNKVWKKGGNGKEEKGRGEERLWRCQCCPCHSVRVTVRCGARALSGRVQTRHRPIRVDERRPGRCAHRLCLIQVIIGVRYHAYICD